MVYRDCQGCWVLFIQVFSDSLKVLSGHTAGISTTSNTIPNYLLFPIKSYYDLPDNPRGPGSLGIYGVVAFAEGCNV